MTQERFQHSLETISLIFPKILNAINLLAQQFIQHPTPTYANLDVFVPEIEPNPNFYSYFKTCIGAVDGSLIPIRIVSSESTTNHTRKGFTKHNAFVACFFDYKIKFALSGWESLVHDTQVLADTIAKGFKVLFGEYYLTDAGYGISSEYLTTYRGTGE